MVCTLSDYDRGDLKTLKADQDELVVSARMYENCLPNLYDLFSLRKLSI